MISSELAELHKDDLPGYNLASYKEIGIPYYQLSIQFLYTEEKSLPIIQEFALNFLNIGLDETQISELLAIDFDTVHSAVLSLYQIDFVDPFTNELTTYGLNYLDKYSVESVEKGQFTVIVDSITGKIDIDTNQFMLAKTVKEQNIFCIRNYISKPTIESLDFNEMKKAFKKYISKDEVDIKGNLLDIVDVSFKATKYRRISLFIYQNDSNDVRIQSFDNNRKIEYYEPILFEIDKLGQNIAPFDLGDYFKSPVISSIDSIFLGEPSTSTENDYYNYFEKVEECTVVVPLIEQNDCSEAFLNVIKTKTKNKQKINFIISGKEYLNNYQYKFLNKLMLWHQSNPSYIRVTQTKEILPSIIMSQHSGYIRRLKSNNIALSTTKIGITEEIVKISESEYSELIKLIPQLVSFDEIKFTFPHIDNNWIHSKMPVLKGLLYKIDDEIKTRFGISILQQHGLTNEIEFINAPLAVDNNKCEVFLNILNKSIYEPLISNSKSNGDPNFFWITFKSKYPKLHRVIDKIRVYRNKFMHFKLDKNNEPLHNEYIKEDFNGFMPEFIQDGYLYMQYLIVSSLEKELRLILSERITED